MQGNAGSYFPPAPPFALLALRALRRGNCSQALCLCYGRPMKKGLRSPGIGMALGIVLGVAIGAATDKMGLWIAMGVVFGAVFAAASRRSKPDDR